MRVLSFGEILWDIIEGNPYLGGAPFNFAAHFAKCGADTYMISRLGKDELGEQAFARLDALNVHKDFIQWDAVYPTGTVDVLLNKGQPSYTINPDVAYDHIDFAELLDAGVQKQSFDIFGFGTLVQRNARSCDSLRKLMQTCSFEHVFYDVNLRKDCYTAEIIRESISYSNILKLNDDEVPIIAGFLFGQALSIEDFCPKVSEQGGQKIVIVTAGGEGCYIYHQGKLHKIPGKKVQVVDTVGAGDSFSAAFLATYYKHGDPLKAAAAANLVGGFVAGSRGPIPEYSDEVKSLLGIE